MLPAILKNFVRNIWGGDNMYSVWRADLDRKWNFRPPSPRL